MRGWVKLHRCLMEKSIFDNPKLLKVFMWCLFKATHKERRTYIGNQKIELKPGEFITGRFAASEELNMNGSTVWRYLHTLQDNETIEVKSNNKYTIINVVNWANYQFDDREDEQQMNNKRTSNEHQMNTNNNVNNGNKIPYVEIVNYLNERAGKNYLSTTKKTKELINARWAEGFRLDDFKAVIEGRSKLWKDDPEMNEYLRPITLFGTKFESYLNACGAKDEQKRRVIDS